MRSRLAVPVLATLALAGLAGCNGGARPTAQSATDGTPAASSATASSLARTLAQTPFQRSWDLQLPAAVERSWVLPELTGLVFFQVANTHSIYAVDSMSGNTRWVSPPLPSALQQPAGASVYQSSYEKADEPVFDRRLWVIADDILFCLDVATGQLVWRYELPFSPSTGPVAIGPDGNVRVFLGDHDSRLQVVSWEPKRSFPYMAWQWNLGHTLNAQPTQYEELVYVTDHSGEINCFTLDRQRTWHYASGGAIHGSATPRRRALFVGNEDNTFLALNRLTGERLGQLNLNGPIRRAPLVFNGEIDRVYVWVEGADAKVAGLYALTARSDTTTSPDANAIKREIMRLGVAWRHPGTPSLVASTPQHLFVKDADSTVVQALSRASGAVDWTWDLNEERAASKDKDAALALVTSYQDATDQSRTIYTVDGKGLVMAYRYFRYVPPSAEVAAPMSKATPAAKAAPAAKDAAPVDK